LKTLLLFCGASRGVRFATSELRELHALAAAAEAAYASADAAYKQLSAAARKRSLPPAACGPKLPQAPELAVVAASGLGDSGLDDMELYVAPSAAQVLAEAAGGHGVASSGDGGGGGVADEDDPVAAEALAFHERADAYGAAFRALACGFVGRKQREVPDGDHEVRHSAPLSVLGHPLATHTKPPPFFCQRRTYRHAEAETRKDKKRGSTDTPFHSHTSSTHTQESSCVASNVVP
jgi:hypothetical protein